MNTQTAINALVNKVIRYTAEVSKVNPKLRTRRFLVESVDYVSTNARGERYVVASVSDLDDGCESKVRALHIDRVEVLA
jgi:hypothetical protein